MVLNIKNNQNNLFDFATKELSQDALICWLINFIHDKENKELYDKAKIFMNFILKKHNKALDIEDYKLEIKQQYNFIDVFILLKDKKDNDKYAIIIEDKKFTSIHNNQVERYRNKIKEKYDKIKDENIITVYYKPYEETRDIIADVIIDREYMLKNIFDAKINNQIYLDYKNYLETIDYIYQEVERYPLSEWCKKKEIFYMVAKKYNIEKKKIDNDKMHVAQIRGSTFIDWYIKSNLPKAYRDYFKEIYLSLNVNYNRYEFRIRGRVIKYNENIRKKLEEKLNFLCKNKGLETSSFIHKKGKEKSNIFLAKINLKSNLTYIELIDQIEKLEKVIDEIMKE